MLNSQIIKVATIFALITNVVSLISQDTIKAKAYKLYSITSSSPKYKRLADLKHQQVETNKQRHAISAQDNYARWTKLNRKYDQLANEISNLETELSSEKLKMDWYIGWVLRLVTIVPINLLRFWYARRELMFLPNGLFPAWIECMVVNIPWLSRGAIGLIFWLFAIDKVFWLFIDIVKFVFFEEKLTMPVPSKQNAKKTN